MNCSRKFRCTQGYQLEVRRGPAHSVPAPLATRQRCPGSPAQLCSPGMDSWTAWATRLPWRPEGLGHVCPEGASPRLTQPVAHVWVSPTLSSWGLSWSFFDPFAILSCSPVSPADHCSLSVCPFATLPFPDRWLSPLPVPVSRTPPGRAVSTGLATPSPGAVRTRVPRRSRFALK